MSGWTTPSGEGAEHLLTKVAGPASIVVDPHDGGRLVSLRLHDVELLGASPPVPGAPPGIFHGSFVMAPFVGRTAHGQFEFHGKTYQLPLNFGNHAMHGFVFDRPWRTVGDTLSIDLDDRWPFGGRVTQRFDLFPDRLTISASVVNDEREMPAIMGFHPWYRRSAGTAGELQYSFQPRAHYVCDDEGIPSGVAAGGGNRPWDDSFAGTLADPTATWTNGPELTVESTSQHWIVCETRPDGVCIEPLTGPVNGLATGDHAIVGPGNPLTLSMTLRWTKLPQEREAP